jgi:hypothetical protein
MSQFVYHAPEFLEDHRMRKKPALKRPISESVLPAKKRETRAPMPKRESTELQGRGPRRRY